MDDDIFYLIVNLFKLSCLLSSVWLCWDGVEVSRAQLYSPLLFCLLCLSKCCYHPAMPCHAMLFHLMYEFVELRWMFVFCN